ncbi:MAG: hypothetical protein R3C56_31705 [Pirellulaceae bacterium]
MLGQLFVFENVSSKSCRIRILSTTSTGLELQESQPPLIMDGNVVTPPQIDGRRLVVQSDLGQIKVLDIEPTAKTQRVSELATLPKNSSQPRKSWLFADNNHVLVADRQLMRIDVQVATLSMSHAWLKYDGDRFVAPLQKLGNTLIHAHPCAALEDPHHRRQCGKRRSLLGDRFGGAGHLHRPSRHGLRSGQFQRHAVRLGKPTYPYRSR